MTRRTRQLQRDVDAAALVPHAVRVLCVQRDAGRGGIGNDSNELATRLELLRTIVVMVVLHVSLTTGSDDGILGSRDLQFSTGNQRYSQGLATRHLRTHDSHLALVDVLLILGAAVDSTLLIDPLALVVAHHARFSPAHLGDGIPTAQLIDDHVERVARQAQGTDLL